MTPDLRRRLLAYRNTHFGCTDDDGQCDICELLRDAAAPLSSPPLPGSIQARLLAEFRREVNDKLNVVFNGANATPLQRQIVLRQCEDCLVEEAEQMLLQAAATLPPDQQIHEMVNRVTRFEVIDDAGRQFTRWKTGIGFSFQDDGRTLKVFVKGTGTDR